MNKTIKKCAMAFVSLMLPMSLLATSSLPIGGNFKNVDFTPKLYSRFSRYVQVNTESAYRSEKVPSTPGQLELAKILASEMKSIGLKNVRISKYGYVYGELPSNSKKNVPTIGFISHLDTTPDYSGKGVAPQLHENYDGKDIVINKRDNIVLSPKEFPLLSDHVGEDIVTASGNTVLGADDKAGIAVIMSAMEWLVQNPQYKHGKIKVAFTPDEEVGAGIEKFDVKGFGAKYAYTIDGGLPGEIVDENFNADALTIDIEGVNYHPGAGKNKLVNALRIAADIMSSWPENMLPETTEGREGYVLMDVLEEAGITKTTILGIVRDHDMKKLKEMEDLLTAIVNEKRKKYPGAKIKLTFEKEYRNMKDILDKNPEVMKHLFSALDDVGVKPVHFPIRGGTDGAKLTFAGLPTPNVFTGGSNEHSRYEWVSLQGMERSVKVVLAVIGEWEKAK
jgi:tripeptide aminopeptidase